MAAKKKYAYYIKGNQLAIIQRDDVSAGSNNSEYGMYKSPTESISNGIEVQYAYTPVTTLEDETDDLDITRYQALAIVYYIKAKMAEDLQDFETREYFFREFRRQMEKGGSALKGGIHIVQGFKEMR